MNLFGKHGRVRAVPMPTSVRVALDAWTGHASVVDGHLFRPVNRADHVHGGALSDQRRSRGKRSNALAICRRSGCS